MKTTCLAVDIGAESGRVVAGTLANGRLELKEIARFPNTPVKIDGTLRWNIDDLVQNVERAIESQSDYASVGVDTWGVDYVLLDENLTRVEESYHYRDARTQGVMDRLASRELYQTTGIQFLPFNTIFQLASQPIPDRAKHFLTIPDYIHHRLSVERVLACEYTNATTTQLVDAHTKSWSDELTKDHRELFPKIVAPGTTLGHTKSGAKIIAPACHDTGSAVVAIPAQSPNVAWISSGTWSILGVERSQPLINDESFRLNYTNEGGVFDTVRLCKNVMGLWILQECRRAWGQNLSYADLMAEATQAADSGAIFDVDDPRFLAPNDQAPPPMDQRVRDCLAENHQPMPQTRGELIRVILRSLAQKYATLIDQLEQLTNTKIEAIHIFGGGSQNDLLNQMTADASHRPVIAGPVEATAIGNLLVQMISLGKIDSLKEARTIVHNSFECKTFN